MSLRSNGAALLLAMHNSLPGNSINDLYIDGNDVASEGTFVSSVTGAELAYTNWAAIEPNNWGGGEDCASMHGPNGLWNDLPCTVVRPAVCEIERRKFHADAPMLNMK